MSIDGNSLVLALPLIVWPQVSHIPYLGLSLLVTELDQLIWKIIFPDLIFSNSVASVSRISWYQKSCTYLNIFLKEFKCLLQRVWVLELDRSDLESFLWSWESYLAALNHNCLMYKMKLVPFALYSGYSDWENMFEVQAYYLVYLIYQKVLNKWWFFFLTPRSSLSL